jgi:hypothetical protein
MGTIARTALAATLVSLAFAGSPALADTTTAMGDRSGEGSTPFTGLSQAPDANLFTGASTTSIPIQVPSGRKSITPDLALRYSSSGGPSPFGFGWDLPLGRIERSTKLGTPRCDPPHDQFFLILPGGVVELSNDPLGSNDYRPIVEESYLRARKFPAENRWEVYDRSGMKYVFGDSAAARAWTGADVFMQQAGSACQYTGSWALTRVVDPNGNHMDITYVNAENVLYPITIEYGGNVNGLAHLYRITLQYEFRSDLDLIRYVGGVRTRLYLRLQQVRVGVLSGTTVNDFRTYTFSYDQQPGGPNGYQTILNHVEATGYPQETFTYSDSVRGFAAESFRPPSGIQHLRIRNSSGEVKQTLLDMNGDGFVDLVSRPGAGSVAPWTVYRGGPNGFVDQPINWRTPPSLSDDHIRNVWVSTSPCSEGSGLACTVQDTFDLNGDGIPDYVVANSDAAIPACATSTASRPAWKVYLGTPFNQNGNGGGFSNTAIDWCAPSRFVRQDKTESDGSGSTLTRTIRDTIDMDGDGRPDLVIADSTNWQVYLNTGTGFSANPVSYPAPVTSLSANAAHMMMDFNGDGLPDLVQAPPLEPPYYDPVCGGSATQRLQCLNVYYNTGQGFAAPTKVPFTYTFRVDDLVDVNGDGLPDLIQRNVYGSTPTEWRVALNTGGRFEPFVFEGVNPLLSGLISAKTPESLVPQGLAAC